MVPSSLRLVAFATLAAGAVAGILPELGSKDSLSKAEFAKLVGSRNNVRGRALETGAYCNAHSDCAADEYCDNYNECWNTLLCQTLNDAIDESCPDGLLSCDKNLYTGDCGALSDESDSWYGDFCCASSSSDCCDPNVGAIVGIVIACVVVIAVSIVACCWCCKCGCFKPKTPTAPPAQVVMVPQPGTAVVGTAVV